jgi:hypothetical protein
MATKGSLINLAYLNDEEEDEFNIPIPDNFAISSVPSNAGFNK